MRLPSSTHNYSNGHDYTKGRYVNLNPNLGYDFSYGDKKYYVTPQEALAHELGHSLFDSSFQGFADKQNKLLTGAVNYSGLAGEGFPSERNAFVLQNEIRNFFHQTLRPDTYAPPSSVHFNPGSKSGMYP